MLYNLLCYQLTYRPHLAQKNVDRNLYLAIPETAYEGIWTEPAGRVIIENLNVKLIVYKVEKEEIIRCIKKH